MQPALFPLSKDDRIHLNEIRNALNRASGIFERISRNAQCRIHELQNPVASLPYCLRWGLKACAELIEESTPTSPEEIWLTKQQRAKSLKVRPAILGTRHYASFCKLVRYPEVH